MNKLTKRWDNLLDAVQAMLMALLVKLGPFFVALMPSLVTAYAIYYTYKDQAGHNLALFFALVFGVAFEVVGIVATHTAIELYNAKEAGQVQPVKFKLMAWLVPVYVLGVAGVVGFSQEAFTPLVKAVGIASPFLTCIVYVAVALARDLHRIKAEQDRTAEQQLEAERQALERQAQAEREDREHKAKLEQLALEQKHIEKMERIRLKGQPSNRPTVQPTKLDDAGRLDAANITRQANREEALDAVLDFVVTKPDASLAEIGQAIGKAKSTAGNYVNELVDNGRLHRNGNGWQVN